VGIKISTTSFSRRMSTMLFPGSSPRISRLQQEFNSRDYFPDPFSGERSDAIPQPALIHGEDLGDIDDTLLRQAGLPGNEKHVTRVPGAAQA
jgi:hypothetical protein